MISLYTYLQKLRGPAKRKADPEVSEEQKQRLAEQREKRAAARSRLKEMKAAAKRVAEKEEKRMATDDSVFDEFVSSVAVMELTTPKKKKGLLSIHAEIQKVCYGEEGYLHNINYKLRLYSNYKFEVEHFIFVFWALYHYCDAFACR